jgi:cell division transport system permease protein
MGRNLRRQPLLILTTVATVAMSLVLVGFFAGIWKGADRLLENFAEEVHVTAYLEQNLSPEHEARILKALSDRSEVSEVKIRTEEEDRARNRALLPRDMATDIPDEILPGAPCVDIVLRPEERTSKGVRKVQSLIESLDGIDGVISVLSGGQKVQLAFAIVDVVRVFGLVISIMLLSGAIFFVFSTIRLSVHARKEEIEIRRLMGASKLFIRMPFYLEGVVVGLMGALAASAAIWLLVGQLNDYLHYTQHLRYEMDFMTLSVLFLFMLAGVVLGLLGSAFALGRYLKEKKRS